MSPSFRAELLSAAAEMIYAERCAPENKKQWKRVFYGLAYGASLSDLHRLTTRP
jgi:hypothetical protein